MTDTTAGEGVTDRFLSWLEHEIDEASMDIGAAHQEGGAATEAEKERASCLSFVRERYLALAAQPSAGAQGEAVAWRWKLLGSWAYTDSPGRAKLERSLGETLYPLYATPAQPDTGALKPVYEVEMVSHDGGYEQPAPSVWRVEIDGYCADFETEAAANNFRSAIKRFALHQPDTGDAAALRSRDCPGCGVKAFHQHDAGCPVMDAALSKPNAPGSPADGGA